MLYLETKMKDLISSKLLGLVLKEDVKDVYKIGSNPNLTDNELPYSIHGHGDLQVINIDTLNRKCKEWLMKFCSMSSSFKTDNPGAWYITVSLEFEEKSKFIFGPDNEIEAVIKAVEWVVKEGES